MTAPAIPAVAVLGVGAMGSAILQGLVDSGLSIQGGIRIADSWPDRVAELASLPGVVGFDGSADPAANTRAAAEAGVVILAVKPQQLMALLDELHDAIRPGTTVISIAAGVTTAAIEARLPEHAAVIRVMPNSPARVGRGVTGVAAGSRATQRDVDVALAVFATVGSVFPVAEDMIDPVTGISGSGPAYVFYFVEALAQAALNRGFDAEQARILAHGTFSGAIALMEESGGEPEELRRQVTSPGGTTQAAIEVFDAAGLKGIVDAATAAAVARAEELAAG